MSVIEKLERIVGNKLHLHKAYRSTFDTPDGELVLSHLMKECGLLNPKPSLDPNILQFREGQRHIVLSILRVLGKEPKQIAEQIRESMKHEIDE